MTGGSATRCQRGAGRLDLYAVEEVSLLDHVSLVELSWGVAHALSLYMEGMG